MLQPLDLNAPDSAVLISCRCVSAPSSSIQTRCGFQIPEIVRCGRVGPGNRYLLSPGPDSGGGVADSGSGGRGLSIDDAPNWLGDV